MGTVSHFVVQTARHYGIQTDQNVKRQQHLWGIQTPCLQKNPLPLRHGQLPNLKAGYLSEVELL